LIRFSGEIQLTGKAMANTLRGMLILEKLLYERFEDVASSQRGNL
jgi:hypothetical protein